MELETYQKVVSMKYTIKLKESQIRAAKESVVSTKEEVERLRLEAAWCYDSRGNRTVPTAEDQATEISQQLSEHPHLIEDTVKALRQKKIDLQSDLDKLQKMSEELDPFY